MELPRLVRGVFLERDNRFRVTVRVDGDAVAAHLADPGRLLELLVPGVAVWVSPAHTAAGRRRTAYDLWLVEHAGVLVCVNTRLPNALFAEALADGFLMGPLYPEVRREVALGASRIDYRLSGERGICWVEVKSANLVVDGVALFPDAPTVRGRKHVLELGGAVAAGDAAAIVFVAQRADAHAFAPYREVDPDLADALAWARDQGVAVHALACEVSLERVRVVREIPVRLTP